jgi:hypothetical protein
MTFVLSNSNLTDSGFYPVVNAETAILTQAPNPLNGVSPTFKIVYSTDETVTPENLPVSSGVITVDNPEKVSSIIVGGVTYTLATTDTPTATEYVISGNNQVTIPAIVTQPTITNAVVVTQGDTLKTIKLSQVPSILYRLPIIGNITIQDSFENSPNSQLTLITTQSNLPTFRENLAVGKQVEIFNYAFVIESYTENIIKDTSQVTVSVNLRGKWDDFLSFPIPLRQTNLTSGTNIPFTDPDCVVSVDNPLTSRVNESGQDLTNQVITISQLAARIGVTYSGAEGKIVVNRGTDFNETTTLSNEIQKVVDVNASFIYLSDKDAIKTRSFIAVNNWIYKEDEIISDVSTSVSRRPPIPKDAPNFFSVSPSSYGNTPFSTITAKPFDSYVEEDTSNIAIPTYQNITLPDDFAERRERQILKEPTTIGEPKFKLREPVVKESVTGDDDPTSPPNHITRLKDLSYNYDRGGVTKTRITTTEIDGSVIREVTERFGFAYTTDMSGVVNEANNTPTIDGSPNQYWRLVEIIYTTHIYDEATGYYLGYNQRGRRYLRLTEEADDFGVGNNSRWKIQQDSDDFLNTATNFQRITHRNYGFRWVPYYGSKRFLLVQHRDYYKDFDVPSQYEEFKVCLRDGTSVRSYKLDPNYVEPMFVLEESQEQHCFDIGRNPLNELRAQGEAFYPPISAGVESFNRTKLKINASKNTVFGSGADKKKEDSYYTYTSNFSAQEVGFGKVVEQTSISINEGVPGIHTRKAPRYERVDTQNEDEDNRFIPNRKRFQYVIWTDPFNGGFPRTGTIEFEAAKTATEAIIGAITRLKKEDVRNTLNTTLTVPVNLNIKPGDIVTLFVGRTIYKRRVMGISHEITFQGEQLLTATTQLNLGIERNIDREVKFKREEIPDPRQSLLVVLNVYSVDKRLGGVVENRMRNRGNYSTY